MILEDNFGVIALGIRPPDFLYIRQDDVIQLMESIKSEKKIIRSWVRKRREPPLLSNGEPDLSPGSQRLDLLTKNTLADNKNSIKLYKTLYKQHNHSLLPFLGKHCYIVTVNTL